MDHSFVTAVSSHLSSGVTWQRSTGHTSWKHGSKIIAMRTRHREIIPIRSINLPDEALATAIQAILCGSLHDPYNICNTCPRGNVAFRGRGCLSPVVGEGRGGVLFDHYNCTAIAGKTIFLWRLKPQDGNWVIVGGFIYHGEHNA